MNDDVFPWRCSCHHWASWGDGGSVRLRAQCSGGTKVRRPSDDRPVCANCVSCDPADSAGFSVPGRSAGAQ